MTYSYCCGFDEAGYGAALAVLWAMLAVRSVKTSQGGLC